MSSSNAAQKRPSAPAVPQGTVRNLTAIPEGSPPAPTATLAQPKSQAPSPPAPLGPQVIRLKKGSLLFAEGENSRAMYLLKTGMIRIFKKKGDASIEIDTVHSGSVIGELAFLDGNPRSASAEALVDCELVEISGAAFQGVLSKMPDWLKIMLKTVVGRLRTASTRIRQLETASTTYVSDKDGKRSATYTFLTPHDSMKIMSALLLVASRNGKEDPTGGIDVRPALLQRYCNQVLGIPIAKMTTLLDVLTQLGVVSQASTQPGVERIVLLDIDYVEQLIGYLNEENLLEPNKRHDVSVRGFAIMALMAKHMPTFTVDERTGLTKVNVAKIKNSETIPGKREPFRYDEFPELVRLGYATQISIRSNEEAYSDVNADQFSRAFRFQRFVMALNHLNEQRR